MITSPHELQLDEYSSFKKAAIASADNLILGGRCCQFSDIQKQRNGNYSAGKLGFRTNRNFSDLRLPAFAPSWEAID